MSGIFARIFGKSGTGRRAGVACYLRENGPVAYALDLFTSAPRQRAEAMMSSELAWAWQSSAREWTQLTRISLSAFLADLPGGVLLVGVEGELPTGLSNQIVAAWIRGFCRIQPGPLAAAITVTPHQQLLFVQQHASDAVNALLGEWGLDKGAAERRSYPRLGPAALEMVGEKLKHP